MNYESFLSPTEGSVWMIVRRVLRSPSDAFALSRSVSVCGWGLESVIPLLPFVGGAIVCACAIYARDPGGNGLALVISRLAISTAVVWIVALSIPRGCADTTLGASLSTDSTTRNLGPTSEGEIGCLTFTA